ncbi:hypothetical protein C8J57DRAFT_1534642 [Mycena rebaudengoi]|nr:hypothetical protein C8J57DRAFT_1534642 [Mycena rebaudengoi]
MDSLPCARSGLKPKSMYMPSTQKGKKEFQTACTVYFKFEDVELRKCGRCQSVRYCSQECQKKHWPTHKKNCSKENGSGIMKLVQNLAGNVVLMTHIQACLILHFDLLRNPHLDKPFIAHLDIGIEPADIPQLFDIYMGKPLQIGKPILGMVQVNAIRPATPEPRPSSARLDKQDRE